jgi:tetratricopeptide (TPR) repeat protein
MSSACVEPDDQNYQLSFRASGSTPPRNGQDARSFPVACLLKQKHSVLLRFLFTLFLILGMAGKSASAQAETDNTKRIVSALRMNEYTEALRITRSELSRFPTSPRLWTLQGLALAGQGNTTEALRSYRHALKLSPNYLAALESAAQMLYSSRNPEATPYLEQIIRIHPDEQVAHAMLGTLAFLRGDCGEAVKHFQKSREQIQAQPVAILEFGNCLAQLNELDSAVSLLQSQLTTNPDNVDIRRGLAGVQLKAGKPQDAIETLSPLLREQNTDVDTERMAAAVYEANKDTPRAVEILHDAIVRDPTNVGLYIDFANISFVHQSFQAGVEMVSVGLKAQPNSAALYLVRGVLYVQLALFDKAFADFEKAEELDPHQAFSAAANELLASEGKAPKRKALADLRLKLAKNPRDAFLWSLEASLLSDTSPAPDTPEFSEAIHAAKTAIVLQPSLASAYDVLAKLDEQTGKTNDAILQYRNALRYDPKDQTALYHLIMMLRKNDSKGEVPEMLKQLAKLRQDATQQEAENNRYKLIVEPDSSKSAPAPGDHN